MVTRSVVVPHMCWAKTLQTVKELLRSTKFPFRLCLVSIKGFLHLFDDLK